MGSAGATLAAVERQLGDATKAATAAAQPRRATPANAGSDPLVADIRQRLGDGKLIDPQGDSAARLCWSTCVTRLRTAPRSKNFRGS